MHRLFIALVVLFVLASLTLSAEADSFPTGESVTSPVVVAPLTATPSIGRSTPTSKATSTPRAQQTSTVQPKQVTTKTQSRLANSPTGGNWISIAAENFDTIFPSTGWRSVDRSNDGYERYWKDATYWDGTQYRAHSGTYAAWPARGGMDGYSPAITNTYSNNMDTRMIYGPFDLSAAVYGYVRFWLWRDMEPNYDWIALEASHTGNDNDFQEVARWTGTSGGNWEQVEAWLQNYVGDNSVWVAWRFSSDPSLTGQGPWVDDIEIWKDVPGQVTASGSIYYFDRNGTRVAATCTTVHLWDSNTNGVDYELTSPTTTDQLGHFQFPTLRNWEYWDSGDPNHSLDLYIVVEATYMDSATSYHQVMNFAGYAYEWQRAKSANVSDGNLDLSYEIPANDQNRPALWLFQDLRRGWEYVHGQMGTDPGSANIRWQVGQTCFYFVCNPYFNASVPYIFVPDGWQASSDTVLHELGHQYMYTANGRWYICSHNGIFKESEIACAWTEGWADFFPMPVNQLLNANDTCYDYDAGPCTGLENNRYYNLETHGRNDTNQQLFAFGDAVEGRVAGALYDLYDPTNDGYDQVQFGFPPIWNTMKTAPAVITFYAYWLRWKAAGNNPIQSLLVFNQNTIDYGVRWNYLPLIMK